MATETDTTLSHINHYQKKLEKYAAISETDKLLYCIHKLKYLPVTVCHLEMTGVGKSVNSLRHQNGIIGEKAKALVNKWKSMVEAEEREEKLRALRQKQEEEEEEDEEAADVGGSDCEEDQLHINEESAPAPTTYEKASPSSPLRSEPGDPKEYNPKTSKQDYMSVTDNSYASYEPTAQSSLNSNVNSLPLANGDKSNESRDSEKAKHKNKKHKSRKHSHSEEKSKSHRSKHSSSSSKEHKKSKEKESSKSHHKSHRKSKEHSSKEASDPPDSQKVNGSQSKNHKRTQETSDSEKRERKRSKTSHSSSHSERSKSKKESGTMKQSSDFMDALTVPSPQKKKKKKKTKENEEKSISSKSQSNISNKDQVVDLPVLPDLMEEDDVILGHPGSSSQLLTDYKPLPKLPERTITREPQYNSQSNEEGLNLMFSSKNINYKQRKIYTGKTTFSTEIPTLFNMCIRILQENIDALEVTGGIPFDILRPVLEKASPQQLFALEDYNPYLLEDSDALWATHCRKGFKNKQRDDMESWRDLYIRCTDEHRERMRSVTENLQKKYVTKAPPKRTTLMAFVNVAAKPPKSVARAQAKYGTGGSFGPSMKPSGSQVETPKSNPDMSQRATGTSSIRPEVRPFVTPKPSPSKKMKIAPLMGKARQLMKKVCRR